MTRAPLPLLGVLFLAGCTTVEEFFERDPNPVSAVERESSAFYLDLVEEEIERGELDKALDRLIAVREIPSLPPEVRLRSEDLIDLCATLMLERAAEPGSDPDDLDELYEMDLSPRMRARVGVAYAERLFAEGSRISAVKQVQKVERDIPNHTESAAAGSVLARAGLDLARDPDRYWLILRYETKGLAALEYLVLTYPLDPACPEAYATLAEVYEKREEYETAIERHEDLVTYHPLSPQAAESDARIPYLRLKRIARPDFDRGEMKKARKEIRNWLDRNPGHPLVPEVRQTEDRCLAMLADSDLYLSRYYSRIENPFGARMHAERALAEAAEAGDEARIEEARALLADLPPTDIGEEAP